MNIFDHLLNHPFQQNDNGRNIFTSYRKFLAVPLVNEVEWTSDKYSYITSFTRRRKRQRSPRVWISAVLIFHSGDSERWIIVPSPI